MGMVQTSTGQGYPLLLNNSGSLNPPPVCLDEKEGGFWTIVLAARPSSSLTFVGPRFLRCFPSDTRARTTSTAGMPFMFSLVTPRECADRRYALSHPVAFAFQNKKAAEPCGTAAFFEAGGESGIRTPDLRIMIPSL